ncbi:MAG: TIR domain-containing protein [Clostridia bacterium]|nr:TIR domain-containing protein [Clostridia bacterium]
MAVYKCKMCGGDLNITDADKVVECDYCGTVQTVPTADNERKMTLFNRANRLRLNNEFDKAAGIYENIVAEFPEEAEAYWGLCLCNYGIEYVDDPLTGKKIPTCHRASFEKLSRDENFELAMEYADVVAQKVYRDEAREIDRINEEILSVSRNERPYDVFICYKETDAAGLRTPDSVMAQDIYDALTAKGYKVFFARITLESKLGQQYEPYIFAALNSAKIMLCIGTKYEYFHAVWVKNEWGRFVRLAAKDKRKVLIPCYRDMDPYDLPDAFKDLQAQDLGKLGAVQDLVRGVEKLMAKDAPAAQTPQAPASVMINATAAQPLIDRGFMALEDKEWTKADDFFEQALNLDAKNGDAYLGKFLASVNSSSFEGFLKELSGQSYINSRVAMPKKEAFHPDEDTLKKTVEPYIVPGYLDETALQHMLSDFDASYLSKADQMEEYIHKCRSTWANNKNLLRAKQHGKPEISAQLDAFFAQLNQAFAKAKQADTETVAQKKNEYQQFVREFQIKAAQMCEDAKRDAAKDAAAKAERRAAEERETEEKYQAAAALATNANSLKAYDQAIRAFKMIPNYKDSAEQIKTLQERRDRIVAQFAKEKAKRRKKLLIAAAAIVIVAITAIVLTVKVFMPLKKYNAAIKLYEVGRYDEAISIFEALDGYKDSNVIIEECKYAEAVQLMNDGQFDEAIAAFEAMDGFKDSEEKIEECKNSIAESEYNDAVQLMREGSPFTAYQILLRLDDYKDAKEQAEKCWSQYSFSKTVSVGNIHTVGLKKDGTVVAVGSNEYGQCDVSGWKDIVTISAGYGYTVGLKKDGTVVAVGNNNYGQCDVSSWKDIVAISAGEYHTVGLKKDGTVVAIGNNEDGQCDVSDWKDIVAISAGCNHTVGLKKDGTVVAVGTNGSNGQCDVSSWRDIVSISAGSFYTVGLKKDGTVVAVGNNNYGQCDVSSWKDIVAISAGSCHTVGLKKDGTVGAVGGNGFGECNVSGWKDIVAVSAGSSYTVGLKKDGTVVAVEANFSGEWDVSDWKDIKLP